MKTKTIRYFVVSFVWVLTACGGGGGGSSSTAPTPSPLAFPLKQAYTKVNASGLQATLTGTLTVSGGSCDITLVQNQASAATASNFDGKSALSGIDMINTVISNCPNPANNSNTTSATTNYYGIDYIDLGSSSATSYTVFKPVPTYPTIVQVGNSGTIGTQYGYTNSTQTVATGTSVQTYSIEADTANTAIVNFTIKAYNTANVLQYTQQSRFRIDAAGTLTYVSVLVNYASGSVLNLKVS